ncbi:MAG: hypothetical protein AAF823_10485 [Planctomycetota bacterium]
MTAAFLSANTAPTASSAPRPIVWIDGSPDPRLQLASLTRQGIAARASATLIAHLDEPHQAHALHASSIAIKLPVRIDGHEQHDLALLEGTLDTSQSQRQPRQQRLRFVVQDQSADALDQTPIDIFALDPAGQLQHPANARLGVGSAANRSDQQLTIQGTLTYLPSNQTNAWTLQDALTYLAALHQLQLDTQTLDDDAKNAPLIDAITINATLESQLEQALSPYRLRARLVRSSEHQRPTTLRIVDPANATPIRLARPLDNDRLASSLRAVNTTPSPGSRRWIARAAPPIRESTFVLQPAWDTTLQSAPDSDYDAGASSDFATYLNVFRRFVLNEDDAFTGPTFDLVLFFDQPIEPRRIPFGDALTLDETGQRRAPLVETSLDFGATWTAVRSDLQLLEDRAGVYFNATTLDPLWIASARAGALRVRVTASLTSALPQDATRWTGSPFYPQAAPEVFDLRRLYQSRIVDEASIYAGDVAGGTLAADTFDAAPALSDWLARRVARTRGTDASSAQLTLAGWWWTLRPGDRVAVPGPDPQVGSDPFDLEGLTIRRVVFDLAESGNAGGTTLDLE